MKLSSRMPSDQLSPGEAADRTLKVLDEVPEGPERIQATALAATLIAAQDDWDLAAEVLRRAWTVTELQVYEIICDIADNLEVDRGDVFTLVWGLPALIR